MRVVERGNMPSSNCVLCHPELYGKNKNWTVLCREHMDECIAEYGDVLKALENTEVWVRDRLHAKRKQDGR